MNKVLAFIMVLLTLAVCAQVRVVSAPETVETVERYDSTNNCPKYQITGFVGQELFLSPQPDYLKKYGYQDIYRSETSHVGSIPCDEIAGHTFKVTNVKSNDKYRNFYNMKLKKTWRRICQFSFNFKFLIVFFSWNWYVWVFSWLISWNLIFSFFQKLSILNNLNLIA